VKSKAYKIIINSLYGLTGNPVFKSIYNPVTAADCTSMIRTCLKKLAKTLEENGYEVLYGFTDNIIVIISPESNRERLMYVVQKFIEEVKSHVPFPMDTFNLELETEMKFIWFVAKNCYLYVNSKDEVKYKSILLNVNTPKVIMKVFEDYMKPKRIKELDINFNEQELIEQIKLKLREDLLLAAEEHKVIDCSEYKSKTSLQYQISERYGAGTHYLIPNTAKIGIGKEKGTKINKPIRYCSLKEFEDKKLKIEDISLKKLIENLKPFLKYQNKTIQKTLY
jgi:DNA polymerase elongation subunit (family B)